ncbi:MAG: HAMP domain-containing protein, partial [Planctomycetaceae bacterium]|nr:HAMP domain-containing protein [Planctomycetaceae bacterium]
MLGLRPKLALAFGGLLAIVLVVSVLSLWVLSRYSGALDRFLFENYRSVGYSQNMKDAVDELNLAADLALRGDFPEATLLRSNSVPKFEKNLQDEFNNVTLPGEGEAAEQLRTAWQAYLATNDKLLNPATSTAERERDFRGTLRDQSRTVKDRAQVIARMNLENMVKEDGEIKRTAAKTRTSMIALAIAASVLAIVFAAVVSRSLLQPLRSLTKSAREIEHGNLDLVVKVRGRDEVGQLAEAF